MKAAIAWVLAAFGAVVAFVTGLRFWSKSNELEDSRRARVQDVIENVDSRAELAVIKETEEARSDTAEGLAQLNQEIDDATSSDPNRDIDDTLDRIDASSKPDD